MSLNENYLDLRGVICPLNLIRCKLALEKLNTNQMLYVDIDTGEPEAMVIPSLKQDGR